LTDGYAQQRVEVNTLLGQLEEQHAEETRERREALEREKEALRLQAESVAQQKQMAEYHAAMIAEQERQAAEAKTTRRIEIAVLVVSVLPLIVGVIALLRM